MKKIISIELNSPQEFEFLVNLLKRLKVAFRVEEKATTSDDKPTVDEVFGSWEMEASADELIELIESSRTSSDRTFDL